MNLLDRTISIIGLGRFGTLLATILSKDFEVLIYHYRQNQEIADKAQKTGGILVDLNTATKADIIILCVPISKTEQMIKDVSVKMKEGALLLDTCSVKTLPCKWLMENTPKHIEILGTHPMFGPVTTKFDLENKSYLVNDKQIVLCPIRINIDRLESIKTYLDGLGLDIIETTPEDHDKQNARTLSLVHFLGRTLNQANIGKQRIFTPGYVDLLKISPHTNSDNWQLFYDMNNYNPFADKIREEFLDAGDYIEDKILESRAEKPLDKERLIIDKIDKHIIRLLEKRTETVKRIGEIKKANGIEVFNPKREEAVLNRLTNYSDLLDHDFIRRLYKEIMTEAKNIQKKQGKDG